MKIIKILVSSLFVSLMSGGCTSSPDEMEVANNTAVEMKSDKKTMENIEKHLSEWQEIKPSLERLVLIEEELKTLITEVGKMAVQQKKALADKENQQKFSVVKPAPIPVALPEPEATPPELIKEVIEASYSNYALQVFTVDNKKQLEKSWKQWSEKHRAILTENHPIYEKIKKDRTTYFRVKINNFISQSDAVSTCQKIKQLGDDCFVTNNYGQRF
ncbi:MAG: SPOR domain-containing protein [Alteromonadales bacterium]|nr:SPOR domain-containing protein [Alteromonadales bacterium]MCP4984717.1 SPOR domain-containing protein [Colwellia sp.]